MLQMDRNEYDEGGSREGSGSDSPLTFPPPPPPPHGKECHCSKTDCCKEIFDNAHAKGPERLKGERGEPGPRVSGFVCRRPGNFVNRVTCASMSQGPPGESIRGPPGPPGPKGDSTSSVIEV